MIAYINSDVLLIFILSIVCVYKHNLHQFNTNDSVFSAISDQMRGLLYGAYRCNTKGQVSCNPTALFPPYPKGHLANYLPKHILKLQIIGAV